MNNIRYKLRGAPVRGTWGDWALIETLKSNKRVSCATCNHYDSSDGSCNRTAHIPKIDGYGHWKKCSFFKLSEAFNTPSHIQQVEKVLGYRPSFQAIPQLLSSIPRQEDKTLSHTTTSQNTTINPVSKKSTTISTKPSVPWEEWDEEYNAMYGGIILIALNQHVDLARYSFEVTQTIKKHCPDYRKQPYANSYIYWHLHLMCKKLGITLQQAMNLSRHAKQEIILNILHKVEKNYYFGDYDITLDTSDPNSREISIELGGLSSDLKYLIFNIDPNSPEADKDRYNSCYYLTVEKTVTLKEQTYQVCFGCQYHPDDNAYYSEGPFMVFSYPPSLAHHYLEATLYRCKKHDQIAEWFEKIYEENKD